MKYVLITPARNEERFITKTLESMVAQTLLPERWVIVDDGSTDRTAELVQSYSKRFPWIELVQRGQRRDRNFAAKVHAFNIGLERVSLLPFEVIGNLDADLSFDADYLEFLMQKFFEDVRLGVAGTPFIENGYDSARDSFEGENHVAGGCQLFRRQCFEEIGGYIGNPAGGIDWIAVTTARMKGWKTRSFPEKRFHHYRSLGTAERGLIASAFSYGEKDYYLGNSPVWELFRVVYRSAKQPVAGLALLTGYCCAALRRMKRPVSRELMCFHRREQMKKLRAIVGAFLRFKKVDNFRIAPIQSRSDVLLYLKPMHQLQSFMTTTNPEGAANPGNRLQAEFFKEYTSPEAISKYTRATAGYGISYLLDHDYKKVYLGALDSLPEQAKKRGLRILEFGCGGGMNLLHLMSVLNRQGVRVEQAIGTDFSPVLIEAAQRDAKNFLGQEQLQRLEFHQAKNENLLADLSAAQKKERSQLQGSFDFIFGVNTIRYCHDAGNELDCVRDIFDLLAPGGVCVVIDMNNRFPLFRSDLKNRLRRIKEEECYVASLDEYAEPFVKMGCELERKEHFCWIPHSAGKFLCGVTRLLSPILDIVVPSRAMRALVVARKPS